MSETGKTITGSLKEAFKGTKIIYATIALKNSEEVQIELTKTNTEGNFTFTNITPGKYVITASLLPLYKQVTENITIKESDTIIKIQLATTHEYQEYERQKTIDTPEAAFAILTTLIMLCW